MDSFICCKINSTLVVHLSHFVMNLRTVTHSDPSNIQLVTLYKDGAMWACIGLCFAEMWPIAGFCRNLSFRQILPKIDLSPDFAEKWPVADSTHILRISL